MYGNLFSFAACSNAHSANSQTSSPHKYLVLSSHLTDRDTQ
ncbi:MAG: hypothetical protein Q8S84_05340 [bacterium]|nr:hypothetical protein [bacterium]MDP3380918.1 hypothetical protein [bacterium]